MCTRACSRRARNEYIQSNIKAYPVLDSEYNTVHGSALLRVIGQIKPSRAKAYPTAFAS